MKNLLITAAVYIVATATLFSLNASAFAIASIIPSAIVGGR